MSLEAKIEAKKKSRLLQLSRALDAAMKEASVSEIDLAKMLTQAGRPTTLQAVRFWLRAEFNPRPGTIEAIAKVLGVDLSEYV